MDHSLGTTLVPLFVVELLGGVCFALEWSPLKKKISTTVNIKFLVI